MRLGIRGQVRGIRGADCQQRFCGHSGAGEGIADSLPQPGVSQLGGIPHQQDPALMPWPPHSPGRTGVGAKIENLVYIQIRDVGGRSAATADAPVRRPGQLRNTPMLR